jgi:hypothetical protein
MSNVQTYQVPKQNFTLVAGEPKVYTKVSDFDRVCSFHTSPNFILVLAQVPRKSTHTSAQRAARLSTALAARQTSKEW